MAGTWHCRLCRGQGSVACTRKSGRDAVRAAWSGCPVGPSPLSPPEQPQRGQVGFVGAEDLLCLVSSRFSPCSSPCLPSMESVPGPEGLLWGVLISHPPLPPSLWRLLNSCCPPPPTDTVPGYWHEDNLQVGRGLWNSRSFPLKGSKGKHWLGSFNSPWLPFPAPHHQGFCGVPLACQG